MLCEALYQIRIQNNIQKDIHPVRGNIGWYLKKKNTDRQRIVTYFFTRFTSLNIQAVMLSKLCTYDLRFLQLNCVLFYEKQFPISNTPESTDVPTGNM